MPDLSWMAWTFPTGTFFALIALTLAAFTLWEKRHPGGNPRKGLLGLHTTRGDRLFITILGGIIIHLLYLAFFGAPLLPALGISLLFGYAVFRWV